MTYYYYKYDEGGRAPEEYLRGSLRTASTLDDAVKKAANMLKRGYSGEMAIISKTDKKQNAYQRKYVVGIVIEIDYGKYGYRPVKSRNIYSINKDGSRGKVID